MKLGKVNDLPWCLAFICPGCKTSHHVHVEGAPCGGKWGWNGSFGKPTFTPSILVEGSKFTEKGEAQYQAWVAGGTCPEQIDSIPTRCHSFVENGMIRFLSDCTHELAGQTVPLPELP